MLKPYVFVACEKVIIDQSIGPPPPTGSGPASLINLFSKIIVEVDTEIPANAVGPKEWAIFSMWDVEPGDENKHYILCTSMLYPDGRQFGEVTRIPIPVILGQRSQMVIRISGFPLGQAGFYTARTWIEESQQTVFGPIEFKIELQVIVTKQQQPHLQ